VRETVEEIRVRSNINRVAVFPDQALITRRCFVELEPGTCEIVFDDMPGSILPGSLQAKGKIMGGEKGSGRIRLLSLDHRPSRSRRGAGRQPTGRRKKLEESRDRCRNSLENLKLRRSFFLGVAARSRDHISRTLVQRELSVEDCNKISDFLFQSLARTDDDIRKARGKDKELEEKLAQLEEEARSTSGEEALGHQVRVGVHVAAKVKGVLELSYVIPGARWSPFYEIHAIPGKETVSLQAYGIISQEAGEPWPDVKISLATTPPPIGASRPELQPLLLQPPADGEGDKAAPDSPSGAKAARPTPPAFISDSAGWDFEVKSPGTVPPDGSPVRALIGQWDLKAEYEYVCIPRFSEVAFIRARLRNTPRTELLPGTMNIFCNSDFIGTREIPFVSPSEEFEVYLGSDPGIQIRRQIERERKSKGGVIAKVQRRGIRVVTTVHNKRTDERPIVLIERMPVSRHKEIRVKDSKFKPDPKKKNRNGIITWSFSLRPKEKREISYSYTVEYPRGMRLQI
jgi:hypothetical protein